MLGPVTLASVGELGTDLPGGDGHHDGVDGLNVRLRNSFLSGHAKVEGHSWFASSGHRCGEVKEDGGPLVEDLALSGGFVELLVLLHLL